MHRLLQPEQLSRPTMMPVWRSGYLGFWELVHCGWYGEADVCRSSICCEDDLEGNEGNVMTGNRNLNLLNSFDCGKWARGWDEWVGVGTAASLKQHELPRGRCDLNKFASRWLKQGMASEFDVKTSCRHCLALHTPENKTSNRTVFARTRMS